jgi:hypothetical protein
MDSFACIWSLRMPFKHFDPCPEALSLAPDDNDVAWRYMDLVSLVSLLETRSLFFRLPGFFEDPWEGCFQKHRAPVTKDKDYAGLQGFGELFAGGLIEDLMKYGIGVNCWHLNRVESEAMWKLYARDGFGVAVRLSVGKLKESFRELVGPVYMSRVAYIEDYADESETVPNLPPCLLKRASFRHENELRLVVNVQELTEEDIIKPGPNEKPKGLLVRVVPDILLHNVVVSPFTQQWYVDLVQRLVERFAIRDCQIIKSALMDDCPWRTSETPTQNDDGSLNTKSKIPISIGSIVDEFKEFARSLAENGKLTITIDDNGKKTADSPGN